VAGAPPEVGLAPAGIVADGEGSAGVAEAAATGEKAPAGPAVACPTGEGGAAAGSPRPQPATAEAAMSAAKSSGRSADARIPRV
jgi:hypothetical protein